VGEILLPYSPVRDPRWRSGNAGDKAFRRAIIRTNRWRTGVIRLTYCSGRCCVLRRLSAASVLSPLRSLLASAPILRAEVVEKVEGSDPEQEDVTISAGAFECRENAAKLHRACVCLGGCDGALGQGFELTVGLVSHCSRLRFEAPGLDFAYSFYHVASAQRMSME
jgi:hypothetical protein